MLTYTEFILFYLGRVRPAEAALRRRVLWEVVQDLYDFIMWICTSRERDGLLIRVAVDLGYHIDRCDYPWEEDLSLAATVLDGMARYAIYRHMARKIIRLGDVDEMEEALAASFHIHLLPTLREACQEVGR